MPGGSCRPPAGFCPIILTVWDLHRAGETAELMILAIIYENYQEACFEDKISVLVFATFFPVFLCPGQRF